jgi:hypothetical protein
MSYQNFIFGYKLSQKTYIIVSLLLKVLRRIFGPKRDEVTGEWRRLHNKELYAMYSHHISLVYSLYLR